MKHLLFVFLGHFLLAQSQFKCVKSQESAKDFFSRTSERPIVMAHRMSPLPIGYAENSLETFKYNLAKNPCTIQEIDVRMTKDKRLVLLHDVTLDRTTTGKGNLSEITFSELQKLDLMDYRKNILKKQKVPELSSILRAASNKTIIVLDKKPGTDVDLMMKEIITTNKLNKILVICYNIKEAQELHKKYPKLMLALGFNSVEQIEQNAKSEINYKNIVALVPQKIQPSEFYEKIHQMKIPISFSAQGETDSNREAIHLYKELYRSGVKIICTDSLNKINKAFK